MTPANQVVPYGPATQVRYADLWAWIKNYTTPKERHLSMQLVDAAEGYTHRLYRDNTEGSPNKGRVVAYELHHPTDQSQHTNWVVTEFDAA